MISWSVSGETFEGFDLTPAGRPVKIDTEVLVDRWAACSIASFAESSKRSDAATATRALSDLAPLASRTFWRGLQAR